MATDPDVDRALRHIRAISERLRDELGELSDEEWNAPTNCPPWAVRQLVAHVISGGNSFRVSVERGLAGQTEPVVPDAERARGMEEMSAAPPATRIASLEEVTSRLELLYEGLSAEQLETICYHRRGNRPARWYIKHRLAEVAFHAWDFRRSLGREPRLDDAVATYLLPTLLESNLPRIYAGRPGGEGRFRLVAEGAPPASWVLAADGAALHVAPGGAEAETTIAGSPAALALLVYGRVKLAEAERRGSLRVEGDRALAERFGSIFPTP